MTRRPPAPKKRQDGEGSLFQTMNNGVLVWCASQTYWTPDGRRRFIRGFGNTPKQALERRTAARKRLQGVQGPKPTRKRLRDLTAAWRADTRSVEESAHRTVRAVENHVISKLGNVTLTELTTKKLRGLFDELAATAGKAAAKNAYNSLSAMLTYAVRQDWLPSNPLKAVKRPDYKPAVRAQDEELIDTRTGIYFAVLKWLRERNDPNYYWVLFLSLGLRRAELCGLEFSSYRADDGILLIDRQFIVSPARIEKRTKNKEVRRLPLEEIYHTALREWFDIRREPVEEWAKGQIFCWQWTNGTWHGRNTNRVWTDWYRILDEWAISEGFVGSPEAFYTAEEWKMLRFRPHFIRHISASNLAEAGIDLGTAQGILGHLSPEMTEHYTHILNKSKQKGIKAITALME